MEEFGGKNGLGLMLNSIAMNSPSDEFIRREQMGFPDIDVESQRIFARQFPQWVSTEMIQIFIDDEREYRLVANVKPGS